MKILSVVIGLAIGAIGAVSCVQTSASTSAAGGARIRAVTAPTSVAAALRALETSYSQSDWDKIRGRIADKTVSSELVQLMQRWKAEHVDDLNVTPVYSKRTGHDTYVVTTQFAADSRTIPHYSLFVLRISHGHLRITGATTGIISRGTPHWSLSRTSHFTVYHSPYQLAGSDRQYLQDLEHQRTEFARKFGVNLPPTAMYHLYPDRSSMEKITKGRCGGAVGETGCTLPFTNPPSISSVLRALYHEPIHVYERALEPSPSVRKGFVYVAPLLLAEGIAVALEDRNADPKLSDYCSDMAYAPLDACARLAYAHVRLLDILSDKGFKHVNPGFAYSLSGSFVKHLILKYGYRHFGSFYYKVAARPSDRLKDYDVASIAVYHQPVRKLVQGWAGSLCPGGC